eukprot:7123388-Ditylum_brightwellii.AAC.1
MSPSSLPTSPKMCSELTSEEREIRIKDLLSMNTPVSVTDGDMYHDSAFQWIVHEDSAQLCPEVNNEDDEVSLNQRYTLALLYFALDGDSWNNCKREEVDGGTSSCQTQQRNFVRSSV